MRVHAGSRDFELQGALGDGAVGLVRKARDVVSGAQVAIKFLAPDPKYIDPKAFDDVATRFVMEGQKGKTLDCAVETASLGLTSQTHSGYCSKKKMQATAAVFLPW